MADTRENQRAYLQSRTQAQGVSFLFGDGVVNTKDFDVWTVHFENTPTLTGVS